MTALNERKNRLRFETGATIRGRAVLVEADPLIARVRLKGTRTPFEVSWEGVYWQALKIATERRRQERLESRRRA